MSTDNITDRKRQFERDTNSRSNITEARKSPEQSPPTKSADNSPKHETKANGDVLRNKTNYTRHNLPAENKGMHHSDKPPWKTETDSKSSSNFSTESIRLDEENKCKDNSEPPHSSPPPQQRSSFLSSRRISSTSSIGESIKSNQSDKAISNAENEFPSGGSFTSADARDVTWKRKQSGTFP